jgi:hypothetical protein
VEKCGVKISVLEKIKYEKLLLMPKYQTGQEERQLQNFDCALGMIAWEHIFTALESVPTPTACCAASTKPWTETI